MISVCMASFNGSKYIELQLESILVQIGSNDEIVIVDDSSTDDTVAIIENFNDSRIRIFENIDNIGVIGSFGRAMGLAKGDIIFLSDHDDIWLPTKVDKIMSVFLKDSDVTLCLTDAHIIDGFGEFKGETYFKRRQGFKQGVLANIIQNKFLGCAIAFRASLINRIFPFPSYIPAHDIWIGLINEVYGKSFFIDEPLFSYRRHSANVSSMTHENLIKMLQWRIILIFQLFRRVVINFFH